MTRFLLVPDMGLNGDGQGLSDLGQSTKLVTLEAGDMLVSWREALCRKP